MPRNHDPTRVLGAKLYGLGRRLVDSFDHDDRAADFRADWPELAGVIDELRDLVQRPDGPTLQ
jgi:hypothetical protein